jgi:hypothetical protein
MKIPPLSWREKKQIAEATDAALLRLVQGIAAVDRAVDAAHQPRTWHASSPRSARAR